MPKMTVADQLEKIKVARAKLDREEKKLLLSSHEKALTQIVQIVRTVGLSHEQVLVALGGKVRGKAHPQHHQQQRKERQRRFARQRFSRRTGRGHHAMLRETHTQPAAISSVPATRTGFRLSPSASTPSARAISAGTTRRMAGAAISSGRATR